MIKERKTIQYSLSLLKPRIGFIFKILLVTALSLFPALSQAEYQKDRKEKNYNARDDAERERRNQINQAILRDMKASQLEAQARDKDAECAT